jgi:phenylpropionate dioxygenase-like ring-hydroxylating dioxygenase large terminal subunit
MFRADVVRFFHPVMQSRALRRGPVRVVIADHPYVLFRDASGAAAALEDRCPHRFAPLSPGRVRKDGRLECPYHGWHFDAQGRGRSRSQPELTKCDVGALQVVERYGYLWIAAMDTPLSAFPVMDWMDEGFELAGSYDMLFKVPLHVVLDNFSEDEHTPWVHTGLGWDEAHATDIQFDARSFDDRTEVSYQAPQRFRLLGGLLLVHPGDTFNNRWTTRFDPVRTVYDIFWTSRTGRLRPVETRGAIFFVPETAATTRLHVFTWVRARSPLVRPLLPVIRRAALLLGRAEIDDDRRFVPIVADTPFEMKGMRLGRFDKPLIHNHKLLKQIYMGEQEVVALRAVDTRES